MTYSDWLRAARPDCWVPDQLVAPLRVRAPGTVLTAYGSRRLGYYETLEYTWHGLQLIVGNYYLLTLLVSSRPPHAPWRAPSLSHRSA